MGTSWPRDWICHRPHPLGGLTAYYQSNVIGGPGAFVVEAEGFESFGQSLIGKLVKEIAEALGVSVVR